MTAEVRADDSGPFRGEAGFAESVIQAILATDPDLAVVIFDRDLRYRAAGGLPLTRSGRTESVVGRTLAEVVPGEAGVELEAGYRAALRGDVTTLEHHTVDRAAVFSITLRPLEAEGEVIGGIAIASDVTARQNQEALLRDASSMFDETFAASPIGMAIVAPNGRWLKVNPALCSLLGRDEDAMLGITFQDVTHPDDLQVDVELARQTLDGERTGYVLEKRYIAAQGHTIWVSLTVSLLRDPAGAPRWFVAQVLDVSARKQLEDRLRHRATPDALEGR